ncbi:MAG: hypothetical protein M3Y51_01400 [Actinomycetota bacterium]|nr:hypothetical protein [Actinomycetota bacterium]
MSDQSPFEANAYAVTYRLLGDAPAAHAAAHEAVRRLQRADQGQQDRGRHWLYALTDLAVTEAVASPVASPVSSSVVQPPVGQPTVAPPPVGQPSAAPPTVAQPTGFALPSPVATAPMADDPSAGLRAALRRRLVNVTPDERVAGALVHLAGYPADFVAEVLGTTPQAALSAAAVLAPPPGVDYRELGEPALTGTEPHRGNRRGSSRMRRPHWTTIAAVAVVAAAVIAATQVTGPRPTLGPPLEEGGAAAIQGAGQRNGDPLTQATND